MPVLIKVLIFYDLKGVEQTAPGEIGLKDL
ncbi:MAG: hypothetical protein JWQ84_678 [Mucilaginibacter sp.]|nr:hypothetical protein [Mucilaginibacter sp.]